MKPQIRVYAYFICTLICLILAIPVYADDFTVPDKRDNRLLELLAGKYGASKYEIAGWTVTCQKQLKERGISESLTNIMEGMDTLIVVHGEVLSILTLLAYM